MMVLSFILYSLTDETSWAEGEIFARTCLAAVHYLLAGLAPDQALYVIACQVAT
jgi:hypothetical protein